MQGLRVGSFTLDHPIAAGGMGEVWRASHRSGAPVALKIIASGQAGRTSHAEGLDPVAALQAEIRAISALQHPNIVPVYDAGVLGPEHEGMSGGRLVAGNPWLAMELAEGSVHDLAPHLDWPTLAGILLQILDGLAHAHARGVVHRDLKPANVLYTNTSGALRIMVADFGLAWAWRGAAVPLDGGTAAYASPEQLLGQLTEQGPWTDLYALGCTTHRLVTGRRPFRGETAEALQRAHLFTDIPPLTSRFPVPDGMAAWVRGLMTKDPHQRFQRAADAAWSLLLLPDPPPAAPHWEGNGDAMSASATQRTANRTLPLEAWRQARPDRPPPDAATTRAPLPVGWERPPQPKSPMRGRGLGLFGLAAPPLVAREVERDQLWQGFAAPGLQLALVTGPSGVGKSRLGAWLCERAHEVGAAEVFRTRFREEMSPSTGLAALAEETLRTHGMGGATLEAHLEPMIRAQELRVSAATLARLLRPTDPTLDAPPIDVDTRVALTGSIVGLRTVGRRLLVWLDDAHLASDAVALLKHLATLDVEGLLLVAVPEVPAEWTGWLDRLSIPLLSVPMGPLTLPETASLVREMLPIPERVATRIAEASGGVPRAAVQLVTDLVQRGQLRGDPGGVEVDPTVPLPASLASLNAGALERLSVLGSEGRTALEIAATLGTTLSLPEWREACQLMGITLDPQLLGRIIGLGAVIPVRGGGRVAFGNGVLHDALLENSVQGDRAGMLHRVCGEVLEGRGDARAAACGDHFVASGQAGRAAHAYLRGMRWLAGWDRERALDIGSRWYTAMGHAPQGDPRWAEGMQVLVALLGVQGGDTHQRATEELLQRGRGDPQAESRALIELTYADLRSADLDRATARAELAWRRAQGTVLRAEAGAVRAEVRRHRGNLAHAEELLVDALRIDRDAAPLMLALARVLCDTDRARQALKMLDTWAERVTLDHSPMTRARIQRARGNALVGIGKPRRAVAVLSDACQLRDRAGFDWPVLDLDLAVALAEGGELAKAQPVVVDALAHLDPVRDARHRADALALYAQLAAALQRWERLEQCIDQLEDLPLRGRRQSTRLRLSQVAEVAEAQGEIAMARRCRALLG